MRRIALAVAAACLSLSLNGCAALGPALAIADTVTTVSSTVSVVNDKVQLEGKRALILASNAYQAAGALVVPLINADKLTPAQVDRVEALNAMATRALAGSERGLSIAQRAAQVFAAADELTSLAGK
jgi:hypothetical protein